MLDKFAGIKTHMPSPLQCENILPEAKYFYFLDLAPAPPPPVGQAILSEGWDNIKLGTFQAVKKTTLPIRDKNQWMPSSPNSGAPDGSTRRCAGKGR
ncbi:MAG: hypothetical protein KME26_12590 [Oscillatoria princeps RMCB-10]|nr:hypothetical protein [Oscillatoria princeps RMCB-10]